MSWKTSPFCIMLLSWLIFSWSIRWLYRLHSGTSLEWVGGWVGGWEEKQTV